MTVHLIKLAVGVDDVEALARRQRPNARGNVEHRTRMMPQRTADLLDGGFMYWVIRGFIQARRALVALQPDVDANGRSLCVIEMAPQIILVRPRAQRPFQGWRYLRPDAVPPDMTGGGLSYVDPNMPQDMRIELARLGLI